MQKLTIKLWLIPLWFLILGASYIVFEVSSYYNKYFINNDWSYLFGMYFVSTLVLIIFILILIERIRRKKVDVKKKKSILIAVIALFAVIIYLFFNLFFELRFFSWKSLFVYLIIITILSLILYNNEREKYRKIKPINARIKILGMLFYGLVISLFVNVAIYNTIYKEYLEQFEYLGDVWEKVKLESDIYSEEGEDTKNETSNKTHEKTLNWHYIYAGDKHTLHEIHKNAKSPDSDEVSVYIDNNFFKELQRVYIIRGENSKEKLMPILKEIDINGFKIIIMPSVLFINTFLSLLLAALIQVFFHKKRFLEGGEAE